QWTLHASPVSQFVHQWLAVFAQQISGRTHSILPPTGLEDILKVRVQSKIAGRGLLAQNRLVEFLDGCLHFIYGNVLASAWPNGIALAQLSCGAVHILELLQRSPPLVSLAPARTRRQPHGKSLSKIFIRMFLRVPTFHVADEASGKRDR